MNNINARERGRSAFVKGKARQPMNDKQFVAIMSAEVSNSDEKPKTVKLYYINEWKQGWDEAKNEAAATETKPTKKKAKKKSKRKTKK